MAILQDDIKLVKSRVMDDVPEGGGAPTAIEVVDGKSNEIFDDISEVARAGGQVSLRKIAVRVDTDNSEQYLDANVIVAEPPNDPNVSITLFATDSYADERTAAVSRMEAYLSVGVQYPAVLYGNHVAGQDTLLVYQRSAEQPAIGQTLVLTKREGFTDQQVQYVRVVEVLSNVLRTFEDDKGTYQRYVLSLRLLNPLAQDYPGFDISRYDYTKTQVALGTKISESVVANAARYYGVTPLQAAGAIGDFTIKGQSIYTQLVPSAQVESPLADVRTNLTQAGVVGAGEPISKTLTATFTTTQNLFIGGGLAPGSLSISAGGVSATDSGGRLMSAGSQIGTVDYENGVLALTLNAFGTSGQSFTLGFVPAAAPTGVFQSQGFVVTAENRSASYVRTVEPAPVRGTLRIDYMAQGRWYVLREQGDGSIRGTDAAYGAGSLNFDTGTLSVTLGALPDAGSFVIYQWVQPEAARASDALVLDNNGQLYWPVNTSGVSSLEPGDKAIEPGGLSIAWNDGTDRTATDDGAGNLVGDATGTVAYARGVVRLSPKVLPPPGTPIDITLSTLTKSTATLTLASGSGSFGVGNIAPGSVEFVVTGQLKAQYLLTGVVNWGGVASYRISDDGAGALRAHLADRTLVVGSIDYAAGTFTLNASTGLPVDLMLQVGAWDNVYLLMDEPERPLWGYAQVIP